MNSSAFRTVHKAAIGVAFAWVASIATPAFADTLAYWNPAGTVNTSSPLPPTTVSADLSAAGNLSGGPGLTGGAWANAYALDNWPAGALDANDYLAFSTPAPTSLIRPSFFRCTTISTEAATGRFARTSTVTLQRSPPEHFPASSLAAS